ncbi:MAG: hypothetical protein E2P02_02055 [Acidobacteria bacterium]|nr:MAG: hypothetical protein E2P02_02055 [Acidobacteriota bacterium]
MHPFRTTWLLAGSIIIILIAVSSAFSHRGHKTPEKAAVAAIETEGASPAGAIAPFVQKGIDWLAAARSTRTEAGAPAPMPRSASATRTR